MGCCRSHVVFEEFLELGLPDTKSPFLTHASRSWGKDLELRASCLAAFFLACSFFTSFFSPLLFLSPIFLLFVYFLVGVPALIESVEDLFLFEVNIDVLMTLAAFSSVFIGGAMEGGLLLVLFALSHSMEEMVSREAKGALARLKEASPKKGLLLLEDGRLKEMAVEDILLGQKLLVQAGQMIPLDGKVVEGESALNLAHLTGESEPVRKKAGDTVPSGATVQEGSLVLEVTHASFDSTLSRIIHLVTEAQEAKPKLQRWFDRLSKAYAMTIISLFVLFALSFPYVLQIPFLGVEGSLYRSLAFLIAASPCALILAIPTAYLSAISACAAQGVLLKGGVVLDALTTCKHIAFDKTGTLTTGKLTCLGYEHLEGPTLSKEEIMGVVHGVEKQAKHPVAEALMRFAQEVAPVKVEKFLSLPGKGVEATLGQKTVRIGNLLLFPSLTPSLKERVAKAREGGFLIALLQLDQSLYLFRFQDTLREGIASIIQTLQASFSTTLLTGDAKENGESVAKAVGIAACFSELQPEDKLAHVKRLADQGGLVMVGDGMNDAPALARATVGIAMGQVGTGAALDASDVVLLKDDLEKIAWLVDKAKKTRWIVVENLCLATLAIFVAAFPALLGMVPLWLAVILHEGGTVLVGLNALRLLKK